MNKTAGIIVAILLVLGLAAIGGVALTKNSKGSTNTNTPTSNTPAATSTTNSTPENTSTPTPTTQSATNTITYGNNGFSPATLTVKASSTVTIKNDSSRVLQFDSDPHPEHTDDPELNVGSISPGQSKTVTVTKTGTHGYHNHLNDSDTGTLIVE